MMHHVVTAPVGSLVDWEVVGIAMDVLLGVVDRMDIRAIVWVETHG